jgi:hypothetical protein
VKLTSWILGALVVAAGAMSCTSPHEPAPSDGRIVLRFEPGQAGAGPAALAAPASTAATFDSVVVRVFRPGSPLVQEKAGSAPITGTEPIEMTLTCVAEDDKRVSVDLFTAGVMTYHGANLDVDVSPGVATDVGVDAYAFTIGALSVTPQVVPEGSSFSMSWNSAPAAAWYQLQSSATPDFAVIDWEQSVTDTVLDTPAPTGAHYFRVVPSTQFAAGSAAGPEFGYVSGGSGALVVTGFDPGAAIPGETFAIVGENLDFPGTRAWVGLDECAVLRATWDSLVVTLPRPAMTNLVTVTSGDPGLGTDTSSSPFVALRVAYVTGGGTYATEYIETLDKHSDDFGESGVVAIPVEDLDWRDMNVFDIVIVADDTGPFPASWGGGQPARAAAIAFSRANVLAIGKGGAVFLGLTGVTGAAHSQSADADGDYYAPDGSEQVFTTPHAVGGGFVDFSARPATTVYFDIAAAPIGVNLYATTDCARLIVCTGPNDQWTLADFRFDNPGGTPVVYFFWGYADNPKDLTSSGTDVLGNVMYLLFRDRAVLPAFSARR